MSEHLPNQKTWEAITRQAPLGLPIEHLVPGAIVAVSAHKGSCDTTYNAALLEVIAVTGNAILVKLVHDPDDARQFKKPGPFIMRFGEREWYAAEHLWDALREPADGQ